MRARKLNPLVITIFIGMTLTTFAFQNCTKAKFSIDEAAKQKALGDGSIFGNTPGDDGWISGARMPGNDTLNNGISSTQGDDGLIPKFPGIGNDPSVPKFPGMTNAPNIPTFPGMGNTPNRTPDAPRAPASSNTPTAPPVDGGLVTVRPLLVCASSAASNQSFPSATKKMSAVLYKFSESSRSPRHH